jgi:raffinose/stachyose/melibiose transport system permease protein
MAVKSKMLNVLRETRKKKVAYFFIIPTFIFLIIFSYYPAFAAFYYSMHEWTGLSSRYLGFANYLELLKDVGLGKSISNFVLILIYDIGRMLGVPLLSAECIFWLKNRKAKNIYRWIFMIPLAIPMMVKLMYWKFVYNPNLGILNMLLSSIGLGDYTRAWLGDPDIAIFAIMGSGFPFMSVMGLLVYLAGLINISSEIWDAAAIEGANGLKRFLNIDLPLLRSDISVLLILGCLSAVQDYQRILVLTEGGPGFSTVIPALHMYLQAFQYGRMGYAASLGVILFFVVLILTLINRRFIKGMKL